MVISAEEYFIKYFPKLAEKHLHEPQIKAINRVIGGNNTLSIIPTGGGKSWIYWVAGLALKGITLVISPLIALIDEQAEKIREQGFDVMVLHGGNAGLKQLEILKNFCNGKLNPNFIFVSPERVATDGFFEYCIKTRKNDIHLIAIDEIHCVSQWGFSFRPFYKRIPFFLDHVYSSKWPIVLGLTATINPREIGDICQDFHINKENVLKDNYLLRGEIELKTFKFNKEDEKEDKLWELLNIHKDDKILIYVYRKYNKRGAEDLSKKANARGFKVAFFHGDMSPDERSDIIDQFRSNKVNVVCATNAFGMGIDIPDIRVVIHFMPPESIEQYYQEVGRSARDKKQSQAYLFITDKNIAVKRKNFIDSSFPSMKEIEDEHKACTNNQIALKTIDYFDNEGFQSAMPYLLDEGIIAIVSKSFETLENLMDIKNDEIERLFNSTKWHDIITTMKNNNISPARVNELIFSAYVNDELKLKKPFQKRLIIDNRYETIPQEIKDRIQYDIDEKKEYKHQLFNYLLALIDKCNNSRELHQEIGVYLGVSKEYLNTIYTTDKEGDKVRSKSEVIIANLLYKNDIEYQYEEPLVYEPSKKPIKPDFTIMRNGKKYFWEHLGFIGDDAYDASWTFKLNIYEKFYKGCLLRTYEGADITGSANDIIQKLKSGSI
jgi:ATP-dependent DNA helicase RecQ